VAELVDALDSESSVRKDVLVRLQSRAPLYPSISPTRRVIQYPATSRSAFGDEPLRDENLVPLVWNYEYRYSRVIHDAFADAAKKHMREPDAAAAADHDTQRSKLVGKVDELARGGSDLELARGGEADESRSLDFTLSRIFSNSLERRSA
jgi:hypothetical protein